MFRSAILAAALGLAAVTGAPAQVASVPQSGSDSDAIRRTLQGIVLPEGFAIELFALVPGARHMAVGPSGRVVFVGTRRSEVWAVDVAAGGDGTRSVHAFAPNIAKRAPNGPCFAPDGTLFVAEIDRVTAFADAETHARDPSPPEREVISGARFVPPGETGGGHNARVCRVGPDGRLYVAIGQPYNVPPKAKRDLYRQWGVGGIVRMDRDGGNREVYAYGIRNSVGLDFNPKDGTLWFTDNQVDGMGNLIPPGELNRATAPGQDFGFPWYGGGATRTADYADETPPVGLVPPQVEMDAHAADLGMTFYRGKAFPERWRGGIFSAQHGSWNRQPPIGARVMFTSLNPDGTAGRTSVFAEGWKTPSGRYLGRPVDVAELPDGSLLVSDDLAGALYRIVSTAR